MRPRDLVVRFGRGIVVFAALAASVASPRIAAAQSARLHHTSTLMADGDVLLCGGENTADSTNAARFLNTCEIYISTAGFYSGTFQFGVTGVARSSHTATVLQDGTVLFAGGNNNGGFLALAEVFNPVTGAWTDVSAGFTARADHTATILTAGGNGGKVLVAGGRTAAGTLSTTLFYTRTGTGTGSWAAAPSLGLDLAFHTATPLFNGQIFIAGGFSTSIAGFVQSTEIYDPVNTPGFFLAGPSLNLARAYHIATPLGGPNHQVLIAGGYNTVDDPTRRNRGYIKFTEIYDPTNNQISNGPSLQMNVSAPTASQLPSGQIDVLGGIGTVDMSFYNNQILTLNGGAQTILFNDFNLAPPPNAHNLTGGSLQYNVPAAGIVVAASGVSGTILDGILDVSSATLSVSSGVFTFGTENPSADPNTTNCAAPGSYCPGLRASLNGLSISDGKIPAGTVLTLNVSSGMAFASKIPMANSSVASTTLNVELPGDSLSIVTSSVTINAMVFSNNDIYSPSLGTWSFGAGLGSPRRNQTSTLLQNADILVHGGNGASLPALASSVGYILNGNSWSALTAMNTARANHTLTVLPGGRVLAVGGGNGATVLKTAEGFGPLTNTWVLTGSMTTQRNHHTATLLPNGRVLVAGGSIDLAGTPTASCEIFDPTNGQWFPAGSLNAARYDHTATLLHDGNVLVVGGTNGPYLSSVEIFYSTAGVWTTLPSLPAPASANGLASHAAARLQDGTVLISGGFNFGGPQSAAYLYNPLTFSWSAATSLNTARYAHSATTLPSNQVVVQGGNGSAGEIRRSETFTPNGQNRPNGVRCVTAGGCWDNTENATYGAYYHTATLTPDGNIYKAGGQALGPQFLNGTETFDVAMSTLAYQGSLASGRAFHAAALLQDGRVLVSGGQQGASYLSSTEASYYNYFPDTRRPSITAVTPALANKATPITITGSQFLGQRDNASSGQGLGGSDNIPRVTIQALDSGGVGPAASGGYLLDLSTAIFANPGNQWSLIDSSFTVTLPGGTALPFGWYHVRAQSAGMASISQLLQVGPALPVGTPGSIVGTAVGTSSIVWNWGLGTIPAGTFDAYEVHYSSSGNFIIAISTVGPGPAFSSTFTLTGLAPNTQGSIQVSAFTLSGAGTPRASGSVFSLANDPLNLVLSTVTNSSVGLSWFANSNSTNTVYEVSMSTDAFLTTISTPIPSTLNLMVTTATIGSLLQSTTYSFRIRAFNGNGVATGFSNVASTSTTSGVSGLTGTATSNSSILWSWNAVTGASSYNVFNSTSGAQIGNVGTNQFTATGLGVNTSQVLQIAAVTGAGQGPLSASATTFTWANLPSVPNPQFVSITNDGFTTLWGSNGNPPGTGYRIRVANSSGTFVVNLTTTALSNLMTGQSPNNQYTVSITGFNSQNIPNGGSATPNFQSFGSTYTLANAPVNLQVVAVTATSIQVSWGANGNPGNTAYQVTYSSTAFLTSTSTAIPFSASFTGLTTTIGGLLSSTTYQIQVMAQNQNAVVTTPVVVSTATGNGGGPPGSFTFVVTPQGGGTGTGSVASGRTVTMSFAPNSFTVPVTISITSRTAVASCQNPPALDAAIEVTAVPSLLPRYPVSLVLSYGAAEPGVTNSAQLAMVRWDQATGACVPLESNSAPDYTVHAVTNHLSVFQLAQIGGGSSVDSTRIFPNPLYVSRNAFVTIDHMPSQARVRIYTLRGEEVFTGAANASGIMTWQVRNKNGRAAASGLYLVLIEAGGTRTVLKLAVLR